MHSTTGLVLLKHLAQHDLLKTKMTTFSVPRYPQPIHLRDVKEAFVAVADHCGYDAKSLVFTWSQGIEVWTPERLFEKLFKVVFVNEKLFPVTRTEQVEGDRGRPLPNLFVSAEKTQIRQIPLVETRPWPFRFLLELGGMIVCRPPDREDFYKELRQYLNNHPQFDIRVDAKRWPDGSVAVFTYWFRQVPKKEIRSHVNVPS